MQRSIVAEYRQGVRGYGYLATAKRLQLPVSTVKGVIARAERVVIQSHRAGIRRESWAAGRR